MSIETSDDDLRLHDAIENGISSEEVLEWLSLRVVTFIKSIN